jgi:superfamily II DNA/RNA helicase
MTQPTHIRAADPDDPGATVRATAQFVYRAHSLDKPEILARVLQARGRGLTIIFTPTKRAAARVAEDLTDRGFAAAAIHGDLGQGAREQALRAFRKGKIDVLVATDVAARGIDVEDVTHVINYACPEDEKTYLHRIGRTGRAGNTGTAITLVDWDDMPRWALIDRALDLGIPEPEETYSTSAHLFTDLEIPEETRGTLPRQARTRAGLEAEEVEDLGETGRARQATPGRRGRPSRRGSATGAEPAAEETGGEPRPRRARRRRRTRGGRPIEGDGPATAAEDQAEGSGGDSPEGSGDGQPTRRRRRRRGGGTSTQISAEMRADQPIEQPIG